MDSLTVGVAKRLTINTTTHRALSVPQKIIGPQNY